MKNEEILSSLTQEEKISLLTGKNTKESPEVARLDIPSVTFVDGPHGVRVEKERNATMFPNLCCVGATWDKELVYELGEALAEDCIKMEVAQLIAPGINLKRNMLCGRNFEYLSEDPIIAGELAASYINGVQSKGIGTCLKHYAANSQEADRVIVNAEIDERTLRELYLKGFEIAVKKSKPESVMSAYNKINAVWCAENKFLLNDVLKEEWGYEGYVVSDWGGVQDESRSVAAGLDLIMPPMTDTADRLRKGVENGSITEERLTDAARRVLPLLTNKRPAPTESYSRDKQHEVAKKVASSGMVLLKNEKRTLPLTSEKYKKITVIGGFATRPLISGQGSAEVYPDAAYIDSPLEELKKRMPETEFVYRDIFSKDSISATMLFTQAWGTAEEAGKTDAIVFFIGSTEGEDTEQYDRIAPGMNPVYGHFIQAMRRVHKPVIVVMQNGGAVITEEWCDNAEAVVEMWLGGEAAGGAIADVLTGTVNPSGKLPETFPKKMRTDLEYHHDGICRYDEKLDVGYRYYDKHPEEIRYPFGHGLSYTTFSYDNLKVSADDKTLSVSFCIKNTGDADGCEVAQIYIGNPTATVTRPVKELKAFEKVFVKAGEEKTVSVSVPLKDLGYYNTMLHEWVTEDGAYIVSVGASSQDIRLEKQIEIDASVPYTMKLTEGRIAIVG